MRTGPGTLATSSFLLLVAMASNLRKRWPPHSVLVTRSAPVSCDLALKPDLILTSLLVSTKLSGSLVLTYLS